MLTNSQRPLPPHEFVGLSDPAYSELLIATQAIAESVLEVAVRTGRNRQGAWELAQVAGTLLRDKFPRFRRGVVDLSPAQRDLLVIILATAAQASKTLSKPRRDAMSELFAFAIRVGITDDSTPQEGEAV